jgi:hypothetical protein
MTARLSLLHSTSVEYFLGKLRFPRQFFSLDPTVTAPAQPFRLSVYKTASSDGVWFLLNSI